MKMDEAKERVLLGPRGTFQGEEGGIERIKVRPPNVLQGERGYIVEFFMVGNPFAKYLNRHDAVLESDDGEVMQFDDLNEIAKVMYQLGCKEFTVCLFS